MRLNPFGSATYMVADSAGGADVAIAAEIQEYALRRVGWRPGIPVRRYQEEQDGRSWLVAEADIRQWRVWRARLIQHYRPTWYRLRLSWLSFRARFA